MVGGRERSVEGSQLLFLAGESPSRFRTLSQHQLIFEYPRNASRIADGHYGEESSAIRSGTRYYARRGKGQGGGQQDRKSRWSNQALAEVNEDDDVFRLLEEVRSAIAFDQPLLVAEIEDGKIVV